MVLFLLFFMKECGVVPSDLDRIAEAENKRLTSKEPNPFHNENFGQKKQEKEIDSFQKTEDQSEEADFQT